METIKEPVTLNLGALGHIRCHLLKTTTGTPICHHITRLPYAHPPLGSLRFRPPQPLPPDHVYGTPSTPLDCTKPSSICPQPGFGDEPPDTSLFSEDCLQVNIWIPHGPPPWPVLFYIHGGFLQFGSNAGHDLTALYAETGFRALVVMPGYRLNAFGFLAGREVKEEATKNGETWGNVGFWDQRCALEWTKRNIGHFGGNAGQITVGGYSAGTYSTFHQLSYDLGQPASGQIIKRVIMWSNGPGVQPKGLKEAQEQFDELLGWLKISPDLTPTEKLAKLRNIKYDELLTATEKMQLHEFRPVTDGAFVRQTLFQEINDGTYARKLKERNIKILIGEVEAEHNLYRAWRTCENSRSAMHVRLHADYPRVVSDRLVQFYCPDGKLPAESKDWPDLFGHIYADVQVHMMERGFINALVTHGAKDLIYRYRIEWRASCASAPPEWGVTHATDLVIWWWGDGDSLKADEKVVARRFTKPFWDFVNGKDMTWEALAPQKIRRLKSNGEVDIWSDEMWERGLKLWNHINVRAIADDNKSSKI